MLVLVRVALDDRPGELALAAAAIAEAGGNILAMDVVERDNTKVIDDFVVELGDAGPAVVAQFLSSVPDMVVDCVRMTSESGLHRELELLSALVSNQRPSLDLLARLVPAIVHCDWAIVISSLGPAVVVTHSSAAGPRIRWSDLPWLPISVPQSLDPDADWVPDSWHSLRLSLAAAPVDVDTAMLVCRTAGPSFRSSELDRLGQLGWLAGGLLQTALGSGSLSTVA